jgi:hypothetical protein
MTYQPSTWQLTFLFFLMETQGPPLSTLSGVKTQSASPAFELHMLCLEKCHCLAESMGSTGRQGEAENGNRI